MNVVQSNISIQWDRPRNRTDLDHGDRYTFPDAGGKLETRRAYDFSRLVLLLMMIGFKHRDFHRGDAYHARVVVACRVAAREFSDRPCACVRIA